LWRKVFGSRGHLLYCVVEFFPALAQALPFGGWFNAGSLDKFDVVQDLLACT
jgi:hypothetical protein